MLQRFAAIFLSALLLLSSSGLAYASHYCGDYKMISKVTLGHEHLSCGMVMETNGCEEAPQEPDCCDNEYTEVEIDDNFAKANFKFEFNSFFAVAFVSTYLTFDSNTEEDLPDMFRDRSPPPLEKDFQVLFETFLI